VPKAGLPPLPELPQLPQAVDLPVVGGDSCERADAARNRARILEAARRLFDSEGPDAVSMDAIAAAAGVGKGTLFRRFGDRSGLAHALLDEHERELQESMIRGEPPLGPGAPPVERLIAYGRARLELFEQHGAIFMEAENSNPRRLRTVESNIMGWHRAHVMALIRESGVDCDVDYMTDVLLGPLTAGVYLHQRKVRQMPTGQIADGYEDMVRRLLAA
jgi:AcrR family transcriptional regulator